MTLPRPNIDTAPGEIGATGIYPSLPAAEYHAHPAMSAGDALMLKETCPAIYRYRKDNPQPSTPALDFGNAAHCMVLEGDHFDRRYHVLPDGYNAGHTKKWAEAIADATEAAEAGKTLIKAADLETIQAMAEAIQTHPLAKHAFVNGTPEVSMFWRDEECALDCRLRLDWMPSGKGAAIFPDLKTTRDANPEFLQREMFDKGYYLRAAWYEDGLRELGFENARYLPIFIEKTPPYEIVPVWPNDAALTWGRIQMKHYRSVVAHCRQTGVWPGYTDDAITLGLPYWAEMRLQEQHERGDFEFMVRMHAPLDEEDAA